MTIIEKYNFWLNNDNTDPKLKEELKAMSQQEINDAFYTNIEFGTAGMRGLLGAGTNRINLHTIRKATQGFATYIIKNGPEACARGIAIGYDNRHMSKEFAMDAASLLAKNNIRSYVFESLRPTPELSFAVRYLKCFGGIMITASHNPKEYNGYKLYDEEGCQLIPDLATKVINEVNAIEDELSLVCDLDKDQEKLITIIGHDIDEEYYKEVLSIQLNKDQDKTNIKIVFSPEHGTSNIPINTIMKRAGYTCLMVEEQASFDPDFSNTPTPNPEEEGAYLKAIELAKKNDADLILVCDPDADRMGVAIKDGSDYKILSGNQTGALLLEYILSNLKNKGLLLENSVMFNTVVTGDLGERVATKYGVETEKTLTGFKFIGEKIKQYAGSKNYVFGYEESYGSLIKPFVRDKDAQQACLMLVEAASYYKHLNKSLLDVLDDLYKELGYYEEAQTSITLKGEEGAKKIKEIINNLKTNRPESIVETKIIRWLDFSELLDISQNETKKLEGFTRSDVLKYFLEDESWIAIRPSGTEPKCKIYYCIKAVNKEEAKEKLETYIKAMKDLTK